MTDLPAPRPATSQDLPSWLSLAREVEPLFGPMADVPGFRQALEVAIAEGRAFCVPGDSRGAVIGGIVISVRDNHIEWLAVSPVARGGGCGKALLRFALDHLDARRPVSVQTFAASCPDGTAARRLYHDFGFVDSEEREPTPTGVPTVLMIRDAQTSRSEPSALLSADEARP